MSRTTIRLRQLEELISDGWHLTSFCLVEPTKGTLTDEPRALLADVCDPAKLEEGQVNFYKVVLEPSELPKVLPRLEVLVGIAKAQWSRELDSGLIHARILLQH